MLPVTRSSPGVCIGDDHSRALIHVVDHPIWECSHEGTANDRLLTPVIENRRRFRPLTNALECMVDRIVEIISEKGSLIVVLESCFTAFGASFRMLLNYDRHLRRSANSARSSV